MPDVFGRYELRALLGRGGMGEVYRAYDTVREREVALKLLPVHLAGDDSFQARFRRESQIAARLSDPHIIPIHDFGEIDGRLYIDMRLVTGQDLGALLESSGRLPADVAVALVGQVASALDAAHDSGLVHRDVKPSNVLLTGAAGGGRLDADSTPFAYLVDFGIARATSQATQLTATTATLGTAAYLAPERIAGKPGDRRVDVYALACMLFELLTARKPWDGEMFAIMYGHVNEPPPSLSAALPGSPAGLDAVIRRGMAKDPEQRYPTAGALARDARTALRSAAVPLAPPPLAPPARNQPTPLPVAPPRPPVRPPDPPRFAPPPTPPRAPTPMPPSTAPVPSGPARPGRKRAIVIAAVVVAVLAIGVGAALALTGGSSTPRAQSTGPTAPTSSGGSGGTGGTVLHAGTGSAVTWADYSSFSKLVGTKTGDTAHAYRKASCKLTGRPSGASADIVSEVACDIPSSSIKFTVVRFRGSAVPSFVLGASQGDGTVTNAWGDGSAVRGLSFRSDKDSAIAGVACALPSYAVAFFSTGSDGLDAASTEWNAATFPDATPAPCNAGFTAAQSSDTGPPSAAKPTVALTAANASALVQQGSAGLRVSTVAVPGGADTLSIDQRGNARFWSLGKDGLAADGKSTYPYDSSIGAPDARITGAAVLTGMSRPTFVVGGTFTTDGAGNAVAFSYSDGNGWGVIKAKSDGNLAPSGQPVGGDRIGLARNFTLASGLLVTTDCSDQAPIAACGQVDNQVIKVWRWRPSNSDFALVRKEGPSS